MTIAKGRPWGVVGPLPEGGVVVRSDAEARAVVTQARRERRPIPVIGLVGGDLHRTLGAPHRDLRGPDAMSFDLDLGEVLADGRLHVFVSWLVARNRLWTRVFAAMNGQWAGDLLLGVRAHPDDGLLDTFEARLTPLQALAVRPRARLGAHLPHPGVRERRAPAAEVDLGRPTGLWLDGERVGRARHLVVRIEPDALKIVV